MIAEGHGHWDSMGMPWPREHYDNPECEWCERSVVTRFGDVASAECESCASDSRRLYDAGLVFEVAPGEPGWPELGHSLEDIEAS